jgi:hypothetical protein
VKKGAQSRADPGRPSGMSQASPHSFTRPSPASRREPNIVANEPTRRVAHRSTRTPAHCARSQKKNAQLRMTALQVGLRTPAPETRSSRLNRWRTTRHRGFLHLSESGIGDAPSCISGRRLLIRSARAWCAMEVMSTGGSLNPGRSLCPKTHIVYRSSSPAHVCLRRTDPPDVERNTPSAETNSVFDTDHSARMIA